MCRIPTTRERRSRNRSLAGPVLLASVVALVVFDRAVADDSDALAGNAHRLAVGVCGTCHGADGNSTHPRFPRLAGQNASYLATQLKLFRDKARGDSDAIGYMWGMTQQLSDSTIDALAKYYAAQAPRSGGAREPGAVQRGKEIYENGVASAGVPACASCHGADAHGLQQYPRLAGQHAQYVLKQLASFQSNMRDVAVMHGVAQNLQEPEMKSVAAFLEAQR